MEAGEAQVVVMMMMGVVVGAVVGPASSGSEAMGGSPTTAGKTRMRVAVGFPQEGSIHMCLVAAHWTNRSVMVYVIHGATAKVQVHSQARASLRVCRKVGRPGSAGTTAATCPLLGQGPPLAPNHLTGSRFCTHPQGVLHYMFAPCRSTVPLAPHCPQAVPGGATTCHRVAQRPSQSVSPLLI